MALNPFLQHHRGCRRSDGLRKSSAQDLWQRMCSEQSAKDWAQKQGCVSIFLERVRNCWVLCTWLYSQQKNTTHRYTLRPQSEWEASPAPSVTLCLPAFNCFCGKKRLRAVSLLPGPRERHLCHSHTSITCLPFTPKPPEQVPAFPENPLAKAKAHRQGLNEVFFKGDIFNHCTYLLIFQIKTFKYLRNEGC